jgi:hypothetical protein
MAGYALLLRFLVGVFQRKFGATVVELALFQLDDSRLSPLVLGVAKAARGIRNTTVVVVAIAYIASDVLVTIQAKPGLRRLVEPLVALGAFRFPLGMPGDYFSGGKYVIQGLSHQE